MRIGVDGIMGCNDRVFLPKGLVHYLQHIGKVTLARISDLTSTSLWKQGWLTIQHLGFLREWSNHWKLFLDELEHGNIRLVEKEDGQRLPQRVFY
jgi:hypothetical protein